MLSILMLWKFWLVKFPASVKKYIIHWLELASKSFADRVSSDVLMGSKEGINYTSEYSDIKKKQVKYIVKNILLMLECRTFAQT